LYQLYTVACADPDAEATLGHLVQRGCGPRQRGRVPRVGVGDAEPQPDSPRYWRYGGDQSDRVAMECLIRDPGIVETQLFGDLHKPDVASMIFRGNVAEAELHCGRIQSVRRETLDITVSIAGELLLVDIHT